MITYTMKETKTAILRTVEIGTRIDNNLENLKWHLILHDGFKQSGWLEEDVLSYALNVLRREGWLERHRNYETGEKFYIRIR